MNFVPKLSLEQNVLVRIAVSLWEQTDVRYLIVKCGILMDPCKRGNWQFIEDSTMGKVEQLLLPEFLKQKILSTMRPIGLEILKWISYHHGKYYSIDIPNEFHWTAQGTIDKMKTAKALMKNEKIDLKTRYNLACIYCSEYDIQVLWNKIPEYHGDDFHDIENLTNVMQKDLVFFWTKYLNEITANKYIYDDCYCQQNNTLTYINPFMLAIRYGNKAAMEYFFPKLTYPKGESILVAAINAGVVYQRYHECNINDTEPYKQYITEVLCFLLSHTEEAQQTKIIRNFAYEISKCFLDWPMQNCFAENASLLLKFLSQERYVSLLEHITNKVISGYKDCDYLNLYFEVWNWSSETYKRYVVRECGRGVLLENLFQVKNLQCIKLIFQHASISMKKFFFGRSLLYICKHLIYDDEWELFKFFITECISSKAEIIKLKEAFEECITAVEFKKIKDKWDKFFHLFDDLPCEFDECAPEIETNKVNSLCQ